MEGAPAAFLLLVLIAATALLEPGRAITCGEVDASLGSCIAYLTGAQPKPAAACCEGVRRLRTAVSSTADRRLACGCMKAAAAQLHSLKDEFVAALPRECGAPLSFPISLSYNCDTIR